MPRKAPAPSMENYLEAVELKLGRYVKDNEAMSVWNAYKRGVTVQETVAKLLEAA